MPTSIAQLLSSYIAADSLAVVAPLVGPLQALLAVLPGLVIAIAGAILSALRPAAMWNLLKLLWRLRVQLVVVVAVLGGMAWGIVRLLPARATPRIEPSASGWPLARGGPERRGAVSGTAEPNVAGVNWTFPGEPFFSSPAVVGNRVYAVSADFDGATRDSGTIYCLDAESGREVWSFAPSGYRATFSSPVVQGNRLICGEGLHYVKDARVICLDISDEKNIKLLWAFRTKSHVECTPVIADGRVYVGAGDDGYYCLKLDTTNPAGEALWHRPGGDYRDAETALMVHEGKVYAGLGVGGKALCVLDAANNGVELKRLPTPFPVFGPPAVSGRKLYFGMGNGDFVNSAETVREKVLAEMRRAGATQEELQAAYDQLAPGGTVWCVDLDSLNVDWQFRTGQTVLGSVAVAGDELFFGSSDGHLYCIDKAGRLIGKFNTHAPIVTSPAVGERFVYVINASRTLYAIDRKRLEVAWEMTLTNDGECYSSPVLARGKVFVGTKKSGLFAVGQVRETIPTPLWPGHLAGPGVAGNPDLSGMSEKGEYQWNYPPDQQGDKPDAYVVAPPAGVSGLVLVPIAAGPKPGLTCLPGESAGQDAAPAKWHYATQNGVHRSPAIVGDAAFLVDGKPGDANRALHCIDLKTGQPRWRVSVDSDASGALIASERDVFVQTGKAMLTRFDLAGKPLWSQPVGAINHPPAILPAMVVAVTTSPREGEALHEPSRDASGASDVGSALADAVDAAHDSQRPLKRTLHTTSADAVRAPTPAGAALVAFDRQTGLELWRVVLDSAPAGMPVVAGRTVLVGTARGVETRGLADGSPEPHWRIEGGSAASDLAVDRQWVAYVNAASELVVLSRADGSVHRRISGAVAGIPPMLCRGAVLFATKEAIMRLALDDKSAAPTQWVDASWLGTPAGPMILIDGRIYMGRAGWGMTRFGPGR